MRVIIAGSRSITDSVALVNAINESGFTITEVVSGAAHGVDRLGEVWASTNGIPIKKFIPDWDLYDKAAGPIRNIKMVDYADAAIFLWDGISSGTHDCMIKAALKGLKVFTKIV